jgi:hypothetical protein
MTSYVKMAPPMEVPITMFIRSCEFVLSSLKIGNSWKNYLANHHTAETIHTFWAHVNAKTCTGNVEMKLGVK